MPGAGTGGKLPPAGGRAPDVGAAPDGGAGSVEPGDPVGDVVGAEGGGRMSSAVGVARPSAGFLVARESDAGASEGTCMVARPFSTGVTLAAGTTASKRLRTSSAVKPLASAS